MNKPASKPMNLPLNPSNPASFWVSPKDMASFTFVPGDKPFFVGLRTTHWCVVSWIIMANDEKHVRRILRDLIDFYFKCAERYQNPYKAADRRIHMLEAALNNQEKIEYQDQVYSLALVIKPAPTNQLYKVGWAGEKEQK